MLVEFGGIDPPVPRHAEVKDQCVAAIGRNEAIFGSAPKVGDPRAGQPLTNVLRHRAAQVGPPRLDPIEAAALQHGFEAADGSFDFWKLRHGGAYGEGQPSPLEGGGDG